jgi:predicted HTH transcriptional regulator
LFGLRLSEISAADLEALIENEVLEGRQLEYKLLIGTDDDAKRKFLAAVSSFANASGGDLLVGVGAEEGVATA